MTWNSTGVWGRIGHEESRQAVLVGQLGSWDLEWGWLPRKRPRRRSLRRRSSHEKVMGKAEGSGGIRAVESGGLERTVVVWVVGVI